ncbi:HNH endonuclease [Pseudarthrobacter sulfonivorans]|uniref:HNH endonuclease n=1 Tax=Pseudarthrobacter sulfonivorans TaxID=121292 RepID=A0A0U3PA19_9MICC|nr:HNH endonuclease signature motif containing protein [Pseudarthrobacter sulfonivorans]ALV42240.1 HNH endonuclease [Pseudarthrobacter sulfonivorans]
MEALGDQLARNGGGNTDVPTAATVLSFDAVLSNDAGLAAAIASVNAAAASAPGTLAMAGYVEASDFAGRVEELSRTVDYLQILAAGAVDRTRTQAITAAATTSRTRSWITGWDNGVETLNETDSEWPAGTTAGTPGTVTGSTRDIPRSPADDGCKNTAEFLRLRLRIGRSEAQRRIHLAHSILPASTLTGDRVPPLREHLAAALSPAAYTGGPAETSDDNDAEGLDPLRPVPRSGPVVSSRAGTIISATLDRLKHHTTAENLDRIEHDLTHTAATADPDFLARVARRWADTLDADGTEPTEEALRHTQGAFIRKPRHGLHHLEIFATTDQYEHLATVMNAATNSRTQPTGDTTGSETGTGTGAASDTKAGTPATGQGNDVWQDTDIDLDRRTRSQKQLDGIIGAVKAALSTNQLPTTGGNRPQILATINYQDLLRHAAMATGGIGSGTGDELAAGIHTANSSEETRTGTGNGVSTATGAGSFTFTGPVAATTIRKIACDADIIPVLLGTHGEILDQGRKTRLFTPAQRLALTARDQGCAFPNCTIPAPWCEAHHISYWSHDGPTNVSNGALLCSHHHHLIHKEQWTIHTRHDTPWFTPPRHIDPTQKPQQNHYFKPPPPPQRE